MMNLQRATLAAVLGGPGLAPFDRAQVVIRTGDGRLVQLDRVVGGEAVGPALGPDDLDGLVIAHEALLAPQPCPVECLVHAWHLGPSFVLDRAAFAEAIGAARGLVASFDVGEHRVLVVREDRVGFLRTDACRVAEARARHSLATARFADAANAAMSAWLLAARGDSAIVALLVHALAADRRPEEAAGYRALERNSYGPAFDHQVAAELRKLTSGPRALMSALSRTSNQAALAA